VLPSSLPTFKVALEQATKTKGCLRILQRLAYLAPEDIPVSLLADDAVETYEFYLTLGILQNYSIVSQREHGDRVSIHMPIVTPDSRNLTKARSPKSSRSLTPSTCQVDQNLAQAKDAKRRRSLSPELLSKCEKSGDHKLPKLDLEELNPQNNKNLMS